MSRIEPKKQPVHPLHTGYTSDPTPVADFIEAVIRYVSIAVAVPVMSVVFALAPAFLLVYVVGGVTGLTAAWAELVAQVSATPSGVLELASAIVQSLAAGAAIGLVLALPAFRRIRDRYRMREVPNSMFAISPAEALQMSVAAILLHATLGILVAAAAGGFGVLLAPLGGYDSVVAQQTIASSLLSDGSGGAWPPDAETLSVFAMLMLTALMLAGALIGAMLWAGLWPLAHRLVPYAATEAARSGASALGAAIAMALTKGHDTHTRYVGFGEAVRKGAAEGAWTGVLFGLLVLVGAAFLGVG